MTLGIIYLIYTASLKTLYESQDFVSELLDKKYKQEAKQIPQQMLVILSLQFLYIFWYFLSFET